MPAAGMAKKKEGLLLETLLFFQKVAIADGVNDCQHIEDVIS